MLATYRDPLGGTGNSWRLGLTWLIRDRVSSYRNWSAIAAARSGGSRANMQPQGCAYCAGGLSCNREVARQRVFPEEEDQT